MAEPPQPPHDVDDPRLTWKVGLSGIAIALGMVFGVFVVLGILFLLAGASEEQLEGPGFTFAGSVLQDAALLAAAYVAIRTVITKPTWATIGLRKIGWSGVGWAALGLVSFLIVSAIYIQLIDVPDNPDKIQDQLGGPLTALFAIAIAPPVEEIFFRGLLYRCFRNGFGVVGAVIVSGLIFGGIHAGSADAIVLPLLVILGMILALVYQKTNSLWPCIILHASYNALVVMLSV